MMRHHLLNETEALAVQNLDLKLTIWKLEKQLIDKEISEMLAAVRQRLGIDPDLKGHLDAAAKAYVTYDTEAEASLEESVVRAD